MLKTSTTNVVPEKKVEAEAGQKFKLTAKDKYYAAVFCWTINFSFRTLCFLPNVQNTLYQYVFN
jgi:hypothetical protein